MERVVLVVYVNVSMRKILAAFALLYTAASAQDGGGDLLKKARAAFIQNQSQERYWIWTATTTRSILDKAGNLLETLPSVTIDSPIRSDGKRCSAVVAWGDGMEPYLANASADERCKVEEEVPAVLRMDAVLESGHVSLQSRTKDEITLAVRPDKSPLESADIAKRCAGALEGTIGLDPETYFPKRLDLTVVTNGCERKATDIEEHYEGSTVKAAGGYAKSSQVHFEYALQKDKTGNAARNFWIASHRRLIQPFPKNLTGVVISGRRFKLATKGIERQGLTEVATTATEMSADSVLKFDNPK